MIFLYLDRAANFNRYTSPEQFYNLRSQHKPPTNVFLPPQHLYPEEVEVKLIYVNDN